MFTPKDLYTALITALPSYHNERTQRYNERIYRILCNTPDVYTAMKELVLDSEFTRARVLDELRTKREVNYVLSTEPAPEIKPNNVYMYAPRSFSRGIITTCIQTAGELQIHTAATRIDNEYFKSSTKTTPCIHLNYMKSDYKLMKDMEFIAFEDEAVCCSGELVYSTGSDALELDFEALMCTDTCEAHLFELLVQGITARQILERILFRYYFVGANDMVYQTYRIDLGLYLSTRKSIYE